MDNLWQIVCKKITNHQWRKLMCWSVGIEPVEYHWRCRICGKRFWNYKGKVRNNG